MEEASKKEEVVVKANRHQRRRAAKLAILEEREIRRQLKKGIPHAKILSNVELERIENAEERNV